MKLKFSNNESGYTLLLAVVVIVIFSILGLSLMTITSSGVTKNENRQDRVQAQDLADKGLDIVVKDIQKYLETQIKDNPMGKTDFEKLLVATLTKSTMHCPADGSTPTGSIGITVPGDNGTTTRICIDSVNYIDNLPEDKVEEKDKYKRLVTFKSYGLVNGKQVVSTYKVVIGTDSIPDQLKYAISSNGGSIHFHGGVEVVGDVRSAQDVHISKKAFSSWASSPEWHESVPVKFKPTTGNVTAKIILPDSTRKIYYYTANLSKKGDHNSNDSNDPKYSAIKYINPQSIFNANNITALRTTLNSDKLNIVSKELNNDMISVNKEVENIYNTKNSKTKLHKGSSLNPQSTNLDQTENSISLFYDESCAEYSGKGSNKTCIKHKIEKTNVNITGTSLTKMKDVNIQGAHYINGDLKINYANIKGNAILYVNGDVNIRFSTLNRYNQGNLIIFATGEIFIANISENSSNASDIYGFFFSESNMTMYGVGSNIKITGGLSAKNIYLTGVRGNTKISEINQPGYPSRLQIIYDQNVITQYTKFNRDEKEEFITTITDPEIIDRY